MSDLHNNDGKSNALQTVVFVSIFFILIGGLIFYEMYSS
jgi:hypothetical protein